MDMREYIRVWRSVQFKLKRPRICVCVILMYYYLKFYAHMMAHFVSFVHLLHAQLENIESNTLIRTKRNECVLSAHHRIGIISKTI